MINGQSISALGRKSKLLQYTCIKRGSMHPSDNKSTSNNF